MLNLWNTQPALLVGLITAAIDVAVAAGAPVSAALKAAIVGLVTVLAAILTHQQVYSPATVAKIKKAKVKK